MHTLADSLLLVAVVAPPMLLALGFLYAISKHAPH